MPPGARTMVFAGLALVSLGALLGLMMAGLADDSGMRLHGALVLVVSVAGAFVLIARHFRSPGGPGDSVTSDGVVYNDAIVRAGVVLSMFWGVVGFLVRLGVGAPTRVAGAQFRSAMDQLRPFAPASYLGGDLRVRRHRAAHHVVPCSSAHLPRPTRGRRGAVVRALGLSAVHSFGGHRLSLRHHSVERICRARMVCGPVADHRLGGLSAGLSRHHLAP